MPETIRLLLVDDQRLMRDGLRTLLELEPDLEVIGEAENGEIALKLFPELSPDVVLMDIRMPVMDGVEATRLIKERWPEVRVIVLTIHASCRADALTAGADAFLIKGCTVADLLKAILNQQQEVSK